MSVFGFGEVEIIVIAGLLVLFFGKEKVIGWIKDVKNVMSKGKEATATATETAKA